ncbi:MAG: S1/P1 nuclease [Isosphaeraceae bacterium]
MDQGPDHRRLTWRECPYPPWVARHDPGIFPFTSRPIACTSVVDRRLPAPAFAQATNPARSAGSRALRTDSTELASGPHGCTGSRRGSPRLDSPAARQAVRELLHEVDTLPTVCTWADSDGHDAVPGSAPWHYVNVPLDADRYSDRYCRRGDCVVAKIRQFRKVVADRSRPRAERARALLFLVHLIEDVHQPLHVGDRNDKGGNETQIQYGGEGVNLHRLWDSTLINESSRDEREWVRRIEPLLTSANIAEWSRGGVESWADESLAAARKAYADPRNPSRMLNTGDRLGREYADAAIPVIRLRLAQAGVRLANELNAIFAEPAGGSAPGKAKTNTPTATPGRRR